MFSEIFHFWCVSQRDESEIGKICFLFQLPSCRRTKDLCVWWVLVLPPLILRKPDLMFYEERDESQRKMNISQHDPTLTTRETTPHVTPSRAECDIFLHPLTSEYNVRAWLDNCFLMLKLNIILGVATDIIRYLKSSCWLCELLNP